MNRRRFSRHLTLGLGTAALGLPNVLPLPAHRARPAKRKLGVALVGLGGYSTGQLGPALRETEHCRLSGVVTGTPAKEAKWMREYDLPKANVYNYRNFDRIADNPDIDIVYVVLPNSMHAEFTIRAAEAGKHVICEKPMAMNVAECRQMIAACAKAGVKLGMGYRLHFEPYNQEVMRVGQQEAFGAVRFISCGAGYRMGNNHDQWRLQKALAGTGALGNMGVYAIQAALYAVGKNPVSVSAQEFKTLPEKFDETDETVSFQFEFPGGTVANLATSHNANLNYLHLACDRGYIELQPYSRYGGLAGRTHQGAFVQPNVNQQSLQMDGFARSILDDTPTRVPGEMGLRDMQIIDGILASIADGGRRVPLEDLAF
ncbi:MAG: Gfo/Idh/MocA family oxidoreductase [Catalinimonas sp.]